MRRFQELLLATSLVAAPVGALATPETTKPEAPAREPADTQSKRRLGLTVLTISPELRTFFGSTEKTGVLVARVEPGSPASLAGIAVGDMIVDVHGTKVDDALDVTLAVSSVRTQRLTIKVLRDHQPQTFEVALPSTVSSLEWQPTSWLRELFEAHEPSRAAST